MRPEQRDDAEKVRADQDRAAQEYERVAKPLVRQPGVRPDQAGQKREMIHAGDRSEKEQRVGHSTFVNQRLQLVEAGADEVRNKEVVGVPLGAHGDANRIAPFAASTAQPSNGDIDERLEEMEPQYLA